jgi:hypothetical protein
MTPSNRSQDLTADLLHDLQLEEAAAAALPPVPAPASSHVAAEPTPFVETALYLAPHTWRRPMVARAGRSVSVSAGPLRLRIGRTPS